MFKGVKTKKCFELYSENKNIKWSNMYVLSVCLFEWSTFPEEGEWVSCLQGIYLMSSASVDDNNPGVPDLRQPWTILGTLQIQGLPYLFLSPFLVLEERYTLYIRGYRIHPLVNSVRFDPIQAKLTALPSRWILCPMVSYKIHFDMISIQVI